MTVTDGSFGSDAAGWRAPLPARVARTRRRPSVRGDDRNVLLALLLDQGRQLEAARGELVEHLVSALAYRDRATKCHNARVGRLVGRLARAIGLAACDADVLERAAALHDIGKIGIPDKLLRKPGALTRAEWRIMQTHTTIGARILGGSDTPLLRLAETIALTHHERWDGTGYPQRLRGDAIPFAGRLVAVADTFDAMTASRPYRSIRTRAVALDAIARERNKQFDAEIVECFLDLEGASKG